MKHLFIINPGAGGIKGQLDEKEREIRKFADCLRDPFELYRTKAPLDALHKVTREAETADMLYVYACGGDGTLNECVNGAVKRANVAVTHYPCGTGNDFIRMFGKEDMQKFRDLRTLAGGEVRPLDVIDCNGRYGLNICSVGVDARIGADVHKYSGIPIIGGATGYIVSLVVNLIKGVTRDFRISVEDVVLDGKFTLVCACNGRFYGGGFNPIPDAMPDDGVLDFLITNPVSRLKFIMVVGKYAKGRFREYPDLMTHVRGSYMEIESGREFAVNIDGEIITAKKTCFKLIPKGVNFIFPHEMEYFDQNI